MDYIEGLSDGEKDDKCFLCRAAEDETNDDETLLLLRGKRCFVIMNRFPYNNGHLMVSPYEHIGELEDVGDDTLLEMMQMTKRMKNVLQKAINAEGFNIGINLSRCAGAGLPGHIHLHIVPRWSGDTNFMTLMGKIRVIPEDLRKTYDKIKLCL